MLDRNRLLTQLNKLSDSQWEELIFRLEVDEAHLRMRGTTKSQQNIDLIRSLEQQDYGLQRLQDTLQNLAFFKLFSPQGTYPVGEELRQREEAREQEDTQAALARGDDPELYKITPEKFYSFQRGTEWLGVFRGWDAPRSFRTALLETTIRNSRNRRNCLASAIIGHGGSGKSVALHRLALDLVEQGYKVWWVEHLEGLVQSGLDDFYKGEGQPQFLLIDEIQDQEARYVERLQRHLKQCPFLVLVVAGRSLPNALRLEAKDQFTPDETSDRITILDKISEVLPAWAATASQLKTESLQKARLVRILVVLARRQDPVPQTLEELEEVFLRILVDDLERIQEQKFPGLATAVIDAAIVREVGMVSLAPAVLIALANYHQPHANISVLFEQIENNPRWHLLAPFLSLSPAHNYLLFHHDELAEGVIQASQEERLETYVDDAYRRAVLENFIHLTITLEKNIEVQKEVSKAASNFLLLYFYKYKDRVEPKSITNYIEKLLAAKVAHYAYFNLIFESVLQIDSQKKIDILLIAAQLVPESTQLWYLVSNWVRGSYPDENELDKVFEKFYLAGCQNYELMAGWLKNLSLTQAKRRAREWLKDVQNSHVLCRCLDLLGQDAKQEAIALLSTPGQHPHVLCRCLDLLGQDAKQEAIALLSTPGQNFDVLCRCLDLLGQDAKQEAIALLSTPGQNFDVLCRCLDLLGQDAKQEAIALLSTPGQNFDVLCRCLDLLGQDAKQEAIALLSTPGQSKEVLCRCLDLLGQDAKQEAIALLSTPGQNFDVLCRCLDLLGQDAKQEAIALLSTPGQSKEVLCRCLDLLGQDAKQEAIALLSTPRQSKEVLCRCLDLLGQEAEDFAREKIDSWTKINPQVLAKCFAIAGGTPEAQKAANEILLRWRTGETFHASHKSAALRAPFNTEIRRTMAFQVLNNWHKEYRPVVHSALTVFWNDPNAVADYCRKILERWGSEITYQRKHKAKRYDGHIIKALANPSLRNQAKAESKKMLRTEAQSSGFLTPSLHQQALEISQGQFPSWTGKEGEAELLEASEPTIHEAPKVLEQWQKKLEQLKDFCQEEEE